VEFVTQIIKTGPCHNNEVNEGLEGTGEVEDSEGLEGTDEVNEGLEGTDEVEGSEGLEGTDEVNEGLEGTMTDKPKVEGGGEVWSKMVKMVEGGATDDEDGLEGGKGLAAEGTESGGEVWSKMVKMFKEIGQEPFD
jgi:hypothetical protein